MATISSLTASSTTKIAITEASGTALYTLVHHNYNDGKAMLFRDASIGTKAWRSSTPSSTNNIFQGSTLDSYLTSWYSTLPGTTTKYLTTLDYPVTDANYGGSKMYITRDACTISLAETGLANHANWQDIGDLDCLDTLGCGALYWTRQPSNGTTSAYRITAAGTNYGTVSVTNTSGVRPTLGVLETQYVEYDSSLGAYVLADAVTKTKCVAPSSLYFTGGATSYSNVEPGTAFTLNWSSGTVGQGVTFTNYAVLCDLEANGSYIDVCALTTGTSATVTAHSDYNTTLYFKVKTRCDDSDYNSDPSTMYCSITTKVAASSTLTQLSAPATVYLDGDTSHYINRPLGASHTLSWDAVTGAYGYAVYYSTSQNGTYTWMKDVTGTSTTVNAASSYSTYRYFKVKTLGNGTTTSDSALSTSYRYLATEADPNDVCPAPSTLYLDGEAADIPQATPGSTHTLSWSASTGSTVQAYAVYYQDTGGSRTYLGNTTSLSMQVTAPDGYSMTRSFYVMVWSSVTGGDSGWSSSRSITTKAESVSNGATIPYYNGTSWVSATPWYYNGSSWISPKMWYYNGSEWLPIPPGPKCSATVEAVSGAQYGFTLNSNGYYQSTNAGVDSSYSLCKVNIVADGTKKMYVDCINYGESYFDYGILSNVDTTLELSNTADSTNVKQSFSGKQSTDVQTVDYGVLTAGEHYIYVKYRKDYADNSGYDSLQFKVRFE